MIISVLIRILFAGLVAVTVAWGVMKIRVRHHRWRCPPGSCQRCGYDLRETPQTCPECGHFADEAVQLPTSRRLGWMLFVPLASLLLLSTAWPYLFLRPALLADAKRDINAIPLAPPASDPRMIAVGEVVLLGHGTRVRPISDSHHSGYSGSTYVNINNRVYYRSGGHCDPVWISPVENLSTITEAELVQVLVRQGYRQVFP